MDLFNPDSTVNILPYDGHAVYYGPVLSQKQSKEYFEQLLNTIEWKNDQVIIFGKLITTKRKTAWYGDKQYKYSYSNTSKYALKWTPELLALKALIETKTDETYNSCLLNLYHDGSESMGWHSDDEKDLKKNATIASFSFGAQRKFAFKHKESKLKVDVYLENGSLLVMKDITQTHWLHSLLPTKKTCTPRINLTFRSIDQ